MESAIWCPTPAAASAARRLRPEVSKNSSTALFSNEGELARSITTCAPAMASLIPSPVMLLMPLWGDAATTSWPPRRRMATVFEPIKPVPPITTIFMGYPPVSMGTSPLFGVADRAWLPLVPGAVVATDQEFTSSRRDVPEASAHERAPLRLERGTLGRSAILAQHPMT